MAEPVKIYKKHIIYIIYNLLFNVSFLVKLIWVQFLS